jgi:hypothetical protein
MKPTCLIASLSALVFTLALSSCRTPRPDPAQGLKPADLCKLGETPAREKALAERGLLLRLKRGDTLPVRVTVTGDVLSLPAPQTVKMRVQSDCFVFVHPKSGALQMSFDGKHFLPVNRAFTGTVDFKMSQTEDRPVTAALNLEGHNRLPKN